MKSKDQILLEEAYSKVLLETPDRAVYPPTKRVLKHDDDDAIAFGFLSIVQPRTASSWPSISKNCKITFQGFPPEFQNKLYIAGDNNTIHQELFEEYVAKDIEEASSGTITVIKDGQKFFYDLSKKLNVLERGKLYRQLRALKPNAREILAPAGRIWHDYNVVSFWAKEGEVTPEQIYMLFEKMGISKEEGDTFFIEFAGDKKPLKKVHDYTSGGATKKVLSDEEEKRAAEAMAKAHGAAAVGTKDTAVQKVLKSRKEAGIEADAEARAAGRKPDLRTQQMAQTSEATETFYSFFNK
jgi:hypothetical protein